MVPYAWRFQVNVTEAINSHLNGSFSKEKIETWKKELATVYNRGFWDGYYLGKKMGEWSNENGSKATKKKIYVAKAVKYFDKIGVGEFVCESHSLRIGDEVIITGPTTGYIQSKIEDIRVNKISVAKSQKGDSFSIKINEKIRPSDKLYRLVSETI